MLGLEIPLAVIMTGFVGARMYARASKRVAGWDDWTMLAAWVRFRNGVKNIANTNFNR